MLQLQIHSFGSLSSGLQPWPRRDKIKSVKFQVKDVITEMNNNAAYIDPVHTWTASGGSLNTNFYYKDNLHLIEKENEKLSIKNS